MNTNAQIAQIARINRKLACRDERLHTSRSERQALNVGSHYVVDVYANVVVESFVNLDDLEGALRLEIPSSATLSEASL